MAEVSYRAIEGYPAYRVGDDGSVWKRYAGARNWRRLKPKLPRRQLLITLGPAGERKTFSVGSLVLRAFVGPRPLGCVPLCFPDEDPRNCRLENLRWAPRGANQISRVFRRPARGSLNNNATLDESTVLEIRRVAATGEFSSAELGEMFGISLKHAHNIVRGKSWSHLPGSIPLGPAGDKIAHCGRGEKHRLSKLTESDARQIRELSAAGLSQAGLAERFGVARSTIRQVLTGRTWAWIA